MKREYLPRQTSIIPRCEQKINMKANRERFAVALTGCAKKGFDEHIVDYPATADQYESTRSLEASQTVAKILYVILVLFWTYPFAGFYSGHGEKRVYSHGAFLLLLLLLGLDLEKLLLMHGSTLYKLFRFAAAICLLFQLLAAAAVSFAFLNYRCSGMRMSGVAPRRPRRKCPRPRPLEPDQSCRTTRKWRRPSGDSGQSDASIDKKRLFFLHANSLFSLLY